MYILNFFKVPCSYMKEVSFEFSSTVVSIAGNWQINSVKFLQKIGTSIVLINFSPKVSQSIQQESFKGEKSFEAFV